LLALGDSVELLATAIVARSFANQQAALLVAVDDRHHRGTIHVERSRHRYLRNTGLQWIADPFRTPLVPRPSFACY
jgi:hypothetical protein